MDCKILWQYRIILSADTASEVRQLSLIHISGKVVAIIGDGAFTGGMVYEGMNNVSNLKDVYKRQVWQMPSQKRR